MAKANGKKSAKQAKAWRPRPALAVYVPVVHGIGATSADDWAGTSVRALAHWWTEGKREVHARDVGCPDPRAAGCPMAIVTFV
jgi:hypothetical protein